MAYRTIVATLGVADSLILTVSGSADDLLESDPSSFRFIADSHASCATFNLLCHEGLMDGYIESPAQVSAHMIDLLELLGNLEPNYVSTCSAFWRFYDYL